MKYAPLGNGSCTITALRAPGWLQVHSWRTIVGQSLEEIAFALTRPRSPPLVKRLTEIEDENKPPHRAEAEALAIAKELDAILIVDDHAARSTAKLMQVECHGTGYLLGRMYQEGHISRDEAIRKLTEMRRAGWRLSEDDYRTILDYLTTL